MAGISAWIPIRRGDRSGLAALKPQRSCQTGLLYENPTFQSSLTSYRIPSWNPPPQNCRAFVAAGKVDRRPPSRFGPGAKKAGLNDKVPEVITGPPPMDSR